MQKHANPWLSRLVLLAALQTIAHCLILLERLNIHSLSSSFTVPFATSFSVAPQVALSLEEMDMRTRQFSLTHVVQINSPTSLQINFALQLSSGSMSSAWVKVSLLLTDSPLLEFRATQLSMSQLSPTVAYLTPKDYQNSSSYRLAVFPLVTPVRFSFSTQNSTCFQISISRLPDSLTGVVYDLSYILVTSNYTNTHIAYFYSNIGNPSSTYAVLLDPVTPYLPTSSDNFFLGINGIISTIPNIKLYKYQDYAYFNSTAGLDGVQVGYTSSANNVNYLLSTIFAFDAGDGVQVGCQANTNGTGLYTYAAMYQSLPTGCLEQLAPLVCHASCLNCSDVDEFHCISCSALFELVENTVGDGFGRCLPSSNSSNGGGGDNSSDPNNNSDLNNGSNGVPGNSGIQTCLINCLTFRVQLMSTETQPTFFLLFTKEYVIFKTKIEDNLVIALSSSLDLPIPYQIEPKHDTGSYIITLDSQSLKSCSKHCQLNFIFARPQEISTSQGKALSKKTDTVQLTKFFTVEDRLPDQLQQAFSILGILMGVTAAAGQTSLIKMLFQLEQIIQFHKYLNYQVPVVFKEFIEALQNFKFMDFTFCIPTDIIQKIKELSDDNMDIKGPIKAVYYDNGANYFKNMIPIIISLFLIVAANFLLYLVLKMIPFKVPQILSQKLRVRFPITASDMIQSMVLPATLYGIFQMTYPIFNSRFHWIFVFQGIVSLVIVFTPILLVCTRLSAYKKAKREDKAVQKSVLEDLFQDCKMSSKLAIVLYLYTYYRKLLIAFLLNPAIPGLAQLILLILVNLIQFYLIAKITINRLNTSRLKVITRSINLICIVLIESMVIAYNLTEMSIDSMIMIGVSCTYLAIIATITGILEVLIKIGETVFQKIRKSNKVDEQRSEQATTEHFTIGLSKQKQLKCYIGKPLNHHQVLKNTFMKSTENEDSNSSLQNGDSEQCSDQGSNDYGDAVDVRSADTNQCRNRSSKKLILDRINRKLKNYKNRKDADRDRDEEKQDASQIITLNSRDQLFDPADSVSASSQTQQNFMKKRQQKESKHTSVQKKRQSETRAPSKRYQPQQPSPETNKRLFHSQKVSLNNIKRTRKEGGSMINSLQVKKTEPAQKEAESQMSDIVDIEKDWQ